MKKLIKEISSCNVCKEHLELGPRPIVSAHRKSKIVVIGQAPGTVVHKTGIPWDDKSGENLRVWMGINNNDFYNSQKIAIIPMGFCYPGKGKSGDLPPRKECAPLWHNPLFNKLQEVGFSYNYILLNAGGYTHTSVALTDCVKAIETPVIEVHISNIYAREEFRQKSLLSPNCKAIICGLGLDSYKAVLLSLK